MRFAKPVLAASLLALPAVAQAQPITGLYIGGGVGANLRDYTSETTNFTGPAAANGFIRTNFHTGYAVVGSVGWGFGNGFRVEVEGNYRYNDINSMNSVVGSSTSVSGAVHQYGGMVNAFYDFNMLTPYMRLGAVSFTPYVGLGVGYLVNDWRKVGARASNSLRLRIDDSDGQFAYQGIAGISMGLDSMVPGLAATLEYRYLSSIEPSLSAQLVANNGAVVGNGTYKPGVYNHSILLGLRYAFNAPRPAPVVAAPAPAPAPARTFLVFFDWDRYDLTERARQIIGEAATNYRTVGSTRVEVSGHADRTGTHAYNQRLSERRATAVAAELVRRGVPREAITTQGFSFDRPLVPTAQGVREPQNRRVEIVLR